MSDDTDLNRYVKDPSLLVELCQEVIDQLDTNSEEVSVAEQEAQLRAIAKAVEQLEKIGVPVPDPLRAEKTRLAASLAMRTDAKQALAQLADEFQDILNDLREHILSSLKKLGGRARVSDVIDEMTRQLEGKLLPGDTEWREATKEYAWQNNAKWERFQMTQDGALRHGSPRGFWEIEEENQ